ncbi:cytochrome c oxidase subunit II [Hephaestia mangrovi]|uniref:cytochrome c oxidase subunit II n=1 Tax=Hephaestia mangrovi TaxID=2873268 RepID=UPI0021020524|nr:cytochrome c oxidase subunit II [Hephaestia mangrovi]
MRMIRLKTIAIAAGLALAGAAPAIAQQAAAPAPASVANPATPAPADTKPTNPLLSQDGAPPMAVTPGAGQPVDGKIGLQPQFSPTGVRAEKMHDHLLVPIITVISVLVLLLLLWCMVRYRRAANPVPSRTSHNTVLEIFWTLAPVVILVIIAIPSIGLLQAQFRPAPDNAVTLKATGNQWFWTYEYPDLGDIQITSNILKEKDEVQPGQQYRTDADGPKLLAVDNRVVLPVGVPIRLITTATDVIHSWAVPAFWIKLDAVPGRLNEKTFQIDKPGLYFGQCSELCGANHGFMPIAVEAVPPAEFAAWVRAKGGKMPGDASAPSTAAPAQPGADVSDATSTPAPNLPPAENGTATPPTTAQPATSNAPGASQSDI